MPHYLYSTLSQDNIYTRHRPAAEADGVSKRDIESHVKIKGGTGIVDKNLVTLQGICHRISDEQYKWLVGDDTHECKNLKTGNYGFKKHVQAGFLKFDTKKIDVEKAVKSLNKNDNSAQPTDPKLREICKNEMKGESALIGSQEIV